MAKGRRRTEEERDRARRMKWWRRARFGMFVHWGLYSQLERGEWVMHRENIPLREYEKLAGTWQPQPRAADDWARLARAAGMKYMVMTTKHHDGFCLWDTGQTDYNAARSGPARDLVREYVQACRRLGLKVGFYHSLMDWHHPDGWRCARSEKARRRFVDFTHGCVRELCSNYGKVDVLWYDVPAPLETPALWESAKMNRMVRRLQPDIIINDRSRLPEDFGTPEESIRAAEGGRAWEACMTFNGGGIWGYQPAPPEDWMSVRGVLRMLRRATAGGAGVRPAAASAPALALTSAPASACAERRGSHPIRSARREFCRAPSSQSRRRWPGRCGPRDRGAAGPGLAGPSNLTAGPRAGGTPVNLTLT